MKSHRLSRGPAQIAQKLRLILAGWIPAIGSNRQRIAQDNAVTMRWRRQAGTY
jgi:hypothetical protein